MVKKESKAENLESLLANLDKMDKMDKNLLILENKFLQFYIKGKIAGIESVKLEKQ